MFAKMQVVIHFLTLVKTFISTRVTLSAIIVLHSYV